MVESIVHLLSSQYWYHHTISNEPKAACKVKPVFEALPVLWDKTGNGQRVIRNHSFITRATRLHHGMMNYALEIASQCVVSLHSAVYRVVSRRIASQRVVSLHSALYRFIASRIASYHLIDARVFPLVYLPTTSWSTPSVHQAKWLSYH